MRYMILLNMDEATGDPPSALVEAMGRELQGAAANGSLVDAGGLHPTRTSHEVRLAEGRVTITDGPFAEAKEVVGGYLILEVRNEAEAVESARRLVALHAEHWPGWEGAAQVRAVAGTDEPPPDRS